VLGCTHYPILREVIQKTIGAQVCLIDSGEATALEVRSLLSDKGMKHKPGDSQPLQRLPGDDLDHFYVTDAAERFSKVAERFLGVAPAVEVWGHDELRT
jgi:glutamate racemase